MKDVKVTSQEDEIGEEGMWSIFLFSVQCQY